MHTADNAIPRNEPSSPPSSVTRYSRNEPGVRWQVPAPSTAMLRNKLGRLPLALSLVSFAKRTQPPTGCGHRALPCCRSCRPARETNPAAEPLTPPRPPYTANPPPPEALCKTNPATSGMPVDAANPIPAKRTQRAPAHPPPYDFCQTNAPRGRGRPTRCHAAAVADSRTKRTPALAPTPKSAKRTGLQRQPPDRPAAGLACTRSRHARHLCHLPYLCHLGFCRPNAPVSNKPSLAAAGPRPNKPNGRTYTEFCETNWPATAVAPDAAMRPQSQAPEPQSQAPEPRSQAPEPQPPVILRREDQWTP